MNVPLVAILVEVAEIEPASNAVRKGTNLMSVLLEAMQEARVIEPVLSVVKKATCLENVLLLVEPLEVAVIELALNVEKKGICLVNVLLQVLVVEEDLEPVLNAARKAIYLESVQQVVENVAP